MLKKIISGGQTGADRAALDVALKFNVEHGGWVPEGRKTEDGTLPLKYRLQEMESPDYRERTRQNIRDSHGTLILSYGELTGGSKLTQSFAKVIGKPNCTIDLLNNDAFESAIISKSFVLENQLEVLNVAGPRLSNFPGIYRDVKIVLETMLYLLFLDTGKDRDIKFLLPGEINGEDFPSSIKQAVEILSDDLSLKGKTFIAKLEPRNIQMLYFVMLDYARHRVGFDSENKTLLEQCSTALEDDEMTIEDAVMEILKRLKLFLESRHILRVVK